MNASTPKQGTRTAEQQPESDRDIIGTDDPAWLYARSIYKTWQENRTTSGRILGVACRVVSALEAERAGLPATAAMWRERAAQLSKPLRPVTEVTDSPVAGGKRTLRDPFAGLRLVRGATL